MNDLKEKKEISMFVDEDRKKAFIKKKIPQSEGKRIKMAATAPNSNQRKVCWDARDDHFKCLSANDDKSESCGETLTKFEEQCPKRWVKYFLGQRRKEKMREMLEKQGAVYKDEKKS